VGDVGQSTTETEERATRPEPSTVEGRARAGRAERQQVPRSAHGAWVPPPDRDPLAVLALQETTRVTELVPVRHERMAASPFSFFRGAAAVFAADIAAMPRTGLLVQLCGDAHLANFGGFASAERSMVFDINDFDETLPGPFEWDIKRLAASFEVAGRHNGLDDRERAGVQSSLVRSYATAMTRFAGMHHLDVWYARLTLDEILAIWGRQTDQATLQRFLRNIAKARGKDRLRAFRKLTETSPGGEPRFVSQPPLFQPLAELFDTAEHHRVVETLHEGLLRYRSTLSPDRRLLLGRYRMVDVARKVVGVGSVGTRCWVILLVGRDDEDPLFLQVKEAEASVLEPHLGRSRYGHHGRRVVEGQRLIQSGSDIFLGWERLPGVDGRDHDYYFRQLWDWKASADIDAMSPTTLSIYAEICGYTLARAHARSGDASAIAAYLGSGQSMARAMAAFSSAYADQNEKDHAAFTAQWEAFRVAGA
jgi:uncharacterized protein (DUF2252 family)